MRFLMTLTLLGVVARPAAAEGNEAEKLFHAMEQKVRKARTLRLRYDLNITDAAGKKGTVKGTLVLGEGDRFRAEATGNLFGEAVKFITVSDGTTMKSV